MSGEAPVVAAVPVPDLTGWIAQQAESAIAAKVADATDRIATQATSQAADVANQLHSQSVAAITQVAGRVEDVAASVAPTAAKAVNDAIPQIKDELLADFKAVSADVRNDPVTQRHLALEAVALLGIAALALWIAYLVGSPQAKGIVAWALLPGGIASAIVARLMGVLKVPGAQ